MSGTTILLPFQPPAMSTAQLAAVSFLARHSGRTSCSRRTNPRFLRNLYRRNLQPGQSQPGMEMINLARTEEPPGDPLMSDGELAAFVAAFQDSGFTGSINWYRNIDRNWHLLGEVDPVIHGPALMVYGDRDTIPRSPNLSTFVPDVEEVGLDCGHWSQQERQEETNRTMLRWLARHGADHARQ